MLLLLGFVSVLVFEPVTTIAALILANEPPNDLIRQALPMPPIFTFSGVLVVSLFYKRSWSRFWVILLTCTVLVFLLGLNVSTIGLINIPRGSLYLVMEMFFLILTLNYVYTAVVVVIRRKYLLNFD